MNDAEEVARLRARVAELEAAQGADAAVDPPGGGGTTRAFASGLLIVLACLLAPLSVVTVWASTVVSDTDRYVETVAPVAEDPGVQAAIADEVTAAIMDNLDVAGLTSQTLEALADQEDVPPRVAVALPALAAPLTTGIEDFTRTQAGNLIASSEFESVWADVNRVAHDEVVALLEGEQGGAISAQDNQITLNLAPVIEEVRQRLVDRGFALAERIPTIDKTFVLVDSEGIGQAQRVYSALTTLGVWLPFIALALLAAGVLLARDRRKALLRGSLGITAAMVVLGVVLALVRLLYVETTPAGILTAESAGNVFDILVRFLRTGLRATAVLFLLVALAAFLTGPSTAAARTRALFDRGIGSARSGADAAGWQLDPVGSWVGAHQRGLRLATFIVAGLTLMFWSRPTAWVVVVVALVVALVLAVISFLGRPPGASAGTSTEPPPAREPSAEAADSPAYETAGRSRPDGRGPSE